MTMRVAAYPNLVLRRLQRGNVATAAFVAAALLIPAMAAAEPPTGSRLGKVERSQGIKDDPYEARRRAYRLAECMYFKRRDDVRGYLTAMSEKDQARYQRNLGESVTCSRVTLSDAPGLMGSAIYTPPDVMRGNYAEAAMSKMAEDDGLAPLAPAQIGYAREWFALTGRDPVVDEMAVCVAEQNPAGIQALLATKPETPEEKAATTALGPVLGPCLPQGATLKANRQSLRAALAEALFHRAVAPMTVTVQ